MYVIVLDLAPPAPTLRISGIYYDNHCYHSVLTMNHEPYTDRLLTLRPCISIRAVHAGNTVRYTVARKRLCTDCTNVAENAREVSFTTRFIYVPSVSAVGSRL